MLRLLLFLTALGLAAGAQQPIPEELDISSCPVNYYGEIYDKMFYKKDATSKIIFCFNAVPDVENNIFKDCLKFESSIGEPTYEILTDFTTAFKENVTAIKVNNVFTALDPTCAIDIRMRIPGDSNFVMFKFGEKTATAENLFSPGPDKEFIQYVNGKVASTDIYADSRDEVGGFLGCRAPLGTEIPIVASGAPTGGVLPGCLLEMCTDDGPVAGDSTCDVGAICEEDICVFRHHCAVTGNTIIDHLEKSVKVSNFCPHTLLQNADIKCDSLFDQRRFSDVPLVLGLDLQIDSTPYTLLPDGSVKVPGTPPTYIDATAEGAAVGTALLKTAPGGVLLTYTANSGAGYEIFFDGSTALLTTTYAQDIKDLVTDTGTCLDVDNIVSDESVVGCKTIVPDPRSDSIDCDAVKARCDGLLKAAPFDGCAVDKTPYIEACSNLLCDYPDVDGLLCQVLGTYAQMCELEAWRDTAACPLSVCIGESCDLAKEFCGVSLGGEPRCFCRHAFKTTFAAGKFGGDAVCANMEASLSLVPCLLEESDVDKDSLTLNDETCTGVLDENGLLVFSFDDQTDCGAEVKLSDDGTHITYSNTIMSPGADGVISRSDQFSIEFSCKYTQPEVQTLSLKIMDSSVVQTMDTGSWTYTMTMKAFTEAGLSTELVAGTELTLDQQLWMQLEASNVDGTKLSLVIEKCWATKVADSDATDKYSLIDGGCSDEDSVEIVSNGEALSGAFSFRVFQFVGSEADVFLHCETQLCITSDGCTKTC